MKILITGSTGLLGHALCRVLAPSTDVIGLSRHQPRESEGGRHVVCDLLDAARTAVVIRDVSPDVVIHTQAMSDVDRCEQEPEAAKAQNVETTRHVVDALDNSATWLIVLSTDYVFDGGKGSPYDEEDAPNPISAYGASKLESERVALGYPRSLIVRPSTLFGMARMNFCDHVVTRLAAGQEVEVFADQTTSPTYTADAAEALGDVASMLAKGQMPPARILHVTNTGRCTRLEFAYRIADVLGHPRRLITPIHLAEQRRPAPRPAYSALTSRYLSGFIGRILRPWDDALAAYLRQRH